jgi:hypothetical protein
MKSKIRLVILIIFFLGNLAHAQQTGMIPVSLTIAEKVVTSVGILDFKDGAPSKATTQTLYDNLDLLHAENVYLNTFQGASTYAVGQGLKSIGADDNSFAIFSDLMSSKSLFLTANADVVYYVGMINLASGPMVLETPPMTLSTIDDMWFHWVIDAGVPGPDRGEGGKYLILPPGYDGPLPEGGYFIAHAKTMRVLYLGRSFMVNNDPKPTVEIVKKTLKVYSYTAGGMGTSIAELLTGTVRMGRNPAIPETKFVEASGKSFNTIPPSDYSFYETLDNLVQEEPAGSLDPELMGQIAAIGIVKGKAFTPDPRMKKILTDAAAVGNATMRMLNMNPRESEGYTYYPGSSWTNALFVGGYNFETPPPMVTRDGMKPFPSTGARTLNARSTFFGGYTGITPAMCMRIPGVGSQYLLATKDADKNYFDGAKTYKVILPKGIPEHNFWSFIVYDNQTRSMLQTGQPFPKVGSLNYPRPAAIGNADGSTTIYFAPKLPLGVQDGNWIQTVPGKGYFVCLRLYNPLESFFDKSWKAGEIELVK